MRDNRLKRARQWAGLTQLDLANAVGLSEAQLAKIETGRRTASRDEKTKIASVLKRPVYELFMG